MRPPAAPEKSSRANCRRSRSRLLRRGSDAGGDKGGKLPAPYAGRTGQDSTDLLDIDTARAKA